MKQFILTLTLLCTIFNSYSQEEQFGWQPIDTTVFVCQFDYYKRSILTPRKRDDMRLEIGHNLSKFYSQKTVDQLILSSTPEGRKIIGERTNDVFKRHAQAAAQGKSDAEKLLIMSEIPGLASECIVYKNYPKGEMYVQDAAGRSLIGYYTDDYIPQDWQIEQDTMTYLGYHCQKATCTWRGRDYVAWFTPEIPVNDGPMKFFGLPGLIVKVADTDNAYSFELKGIEKLNKPIYFNTKTFSKNYPDFEPTTRCEMLKKQSRSYKNRIRAIKRDMSRLGESTDDLDESMYDVQELDCK